VRPDTALDQAPDLPGVYIMRDPAGKVLYVGKANSLRRRLASYFRAGADLLARTRLLVDRATDLEWILTGGEAEALILEDTLIKRHHPFFNIRMRDDKRYPLLEITWNEAWPRVKVVRRITSSGGRFFGPYVSSAAMRSTLKLMRKIFKLRSCTLDLATPLPRPCLDYQLELCSAPCVRAISNPAYRADVQAASRFLEGHAGGLLRRLRREMEREAQRLNFERCARLRDIIHGVEQVWERQKMVDSGGGDYDLAAVVRQGDVACALMFLIREGRLSSERHYLLEAPEPSHTGEVIL